MKKIMLVSLLLLTACVAPDDKELIGTWAEAGQNNLNTWESKTPEQQKEAMFNMTGAAVTLDNHINGQPVPPPFRKFVGEGQ